jgi:hypothetical protein
LDEEGSEHTKENLNVKFHVRAVAPVSCMMPVSRTLTIVPKTSVTSAPGQLLPASAVWGSKKQLSADWSCKRDREVLNEVDSRETLLNKAKLANKISGRQHSMEKARRRSLKLKYYVKRNKASRAMRQQHEFDLEEQERGDSDGDITITRPSAKPPPELASRRDRIRREQRRASRDRKCFDYFEPADSLELEPLVETTPPPKKKRCAPLTIKQELLRRVMIEEELSRIIICSESKGPPVSDLYRDGLMLSTDAVKDLQVMLAGQSKARAFAKALAPSPNKTQRGGSPRVRICGGPKASKAHSTKPIVYKGRGKRGA